MVTKAAAVLSSMTEQQPRIPWSTVEERRVAIRALDKRLSQRQIAARLGVSNGTVASDQAALSKATDQGSEVTEQSLIKVDRSADPWIEVVVAWLDELDKVALAKLIARTAHGADMLSELARLRTQVTGQPGKVASEPFLLNGQTTEDIAQWGVAD